MFFITNAHVKAPPKAIDILLIRTKNRKVKRKKKTEERVKHVT